jgi:hypothetical protein
MESITYCSFASAIVKSTILNFPLEIIQVCNECRHPPQLLFSEVQHANSIYNKAISMLVNFSTRYLSSKLLLTKSKVKLGSLTVVACFKKSFANSSRRL